MPGYAFEYSLTRGEYTAYLWYWWRRRPWYQRIVYRALAVVLVAVCVLPIWGDMTATQGILYPFQTFLWMFVCLVPAAFLVFFERLLIWWYTRQQMRGKDKVCDPQNISIDATGIESRSPLSATKVQWRTASGLIEDKEAVYLMLDEFGAVVLPYRVIREHGLDPAHVLRDLRVWRSQAPSRESKCPKCGYDLKALTVQGCPECGWARIGGDEGS